VISYMVSLRTREIGVRMALGARADQVRRMVVRQGLVLAAIGAAIGLVGALGMSRLISSLLYGIAPYDPGDPWQRDVRPAGGRGGGELAARHARGAHRSDRGVAFGRMN
jgi:ABC-type antimicrobial peptide transport system permease subunit